MVPAGASMACPVGPEGWALGHSTLGCPSLVLRAALSAGAHGAHIKLLQIWP